MTTIVSIRRNGKVALGGDGQVSLGNTVIKANARKVRRIGDGSVIAGFAGSTADAFALFERLEEKLERYNGQLTRACVEMAKDWRTDRYLRKLEAMMAVVDKECNLLGQITDKDLIQAALPNYKSLIDNLNYAFEVEPFEELLKQEDKIKVSQLYRKDFEVAQPETRIVEVAAMMIFKDIRRVFVTTADNKLCGVLLRKDIVNMVIRG